MCIKVGFRSGMHKTRTQLEPVLSLIFIIQTRPYYLTGWVKPDLLRLGWIRYQWVGLYLPSLLLGRKSLFYKDHCHYVER